MFIDELFQLTLRYINLLRDISSTYGIILMCAGDCTQSPSPDDNMIFNANILIQGIIGLKHLSLFVLPWMFVKTDPNKLDNVWMLEFRHDQCFH